MANRRLTTPELHKPHKLKALTIVSDNEGHK
jgi:hypothetical protein